MNKHSDDIPAFDDADHEHEWLAQEDALRRERLNLDPTRNDIRDRHYRLLARTLRKPMQHDLPVDFATRVAARTNAALASSVGFEFILMIVLIVTMGIAAGVIIVTYSGEWFSSFNAVLRSIKTPTSSWLAALASCLIVSWLVERWQQHKH